MKQRLFITYILLLLASMATAQVLDSSKVLLPIYKGEKVAKLDKFTGWYLQNDGEWVKAKNKIPNDRTVINPKSDEFSVGKENISLMEMYLFTYDKKEYVVLAVYSTEGYYELPILKSNWTTKKQINFYIFDKRKLYRLITNKNIKKPYSINLAVWCSGVVDNVDRHTNIKNIAADCILKTKANVITNSSNLIISIFPATKDEEEKIYFKLTKTYTKKSIYDSYLLPQNQEKLFSRAYYEADKETFDNFIYTVLDQSDSANKKFTPGPDEVVKPWEQDTAVLRFNIFKESPMFDQNMKDDKIQQDTMNFYNSKDKTERTHGNATNFSNKKDYGKKHKITKTTNSRNVTTAKGTYRVNETTTKTDDDIANPKNNISEDSLKAVRDAVLKEIRGADSLLEIKKKSLNNKNKEPDITEPGFDWNNLGQKKIKKTKTIPTKKKKETIITNNPKINTIDTTTTNVSPINTIIVNKPIVNIDSINAVRLKEKLLLDSIEEAERQVKDSIAKHNSIEKTKPIDTININSTPKIVSEKDAIKEAKRREKFVADSLKQEEKRLKIIEKQKKKDKGVKLMINEPIIDTINDSVIDINRIKLKLRRDSIYKASLITPKNSTQVLTKEKDTLVTNPIKTEIINIPKDTTTAKIITENAKPKYDSIPSQGKITLDTVAGKVFYSIQIGCVADLTSELFYRNNLRLTDRMFIFTYGAQYKYCIGTFKKYKDAVAYLKKLVDANKSLQAYIISFVDGKLAPMAIAKQKSGEAKIPFTPVLNPKK